jgi:hypothetical protein
MYPAYASPPPPGLIFATNASVPPEYVRSGPTVAGKFGGADIVSPVM